MERKIQRKQKNTQGKGTIWREAQKCKRIWYVSNRKTCVTKAFIFASRGEMCLMQRWWPSNKSRGNCSSQVKKKTTKGNPKVWQRYTNSDWTEQRAKNQSNLSNCNGGQYAPTSPRTGRKAMKEEATQTCCSGHSQDKGV